MSPCSRLPIKNTFVHFDVGERSAPCRSKSAPPVLGSHCQLPRTKKKRKKSTEESSLRRLRKLEEEALQDFATQARQERLASWATRLLSRRRAVAWRWTRLARMLPDRDVRPVLRATLSMRVFTHVLQYCMHPLDFVLFQQASVLLRSGKSVELWANNAVAQSIKVKKFILAVEHFLALARSCEFGLHLPNNDMLYFHWDPDVAVESLQSRVFCDCGLPPEKQRLQCLTCDLQGDTLGRSGVLPGDVIDVFSI
jgi:hypothetical protein